MRILVDGDILVMKAGFAAERRVTREVGGETIKTREILSEADAYYGIDTILNAIRDQFPDDELVLFIGSGGSFRSRVREDYKANRDPANRPLLYDECRDYMRYLGAYEIPHIETDDALSILQYESIAANNNDVAASSTVIASIDKDLDSVPGYHYNFDKGFFYLVNWEDAVYSECSQIMQGDSTDNIKGCPGIGVKKAAKILDTVYPDIKAMRTITKQTFKDNEYKFKNIHWATAHHEAVHLVTMLRSPSHPMLKPDEVEEMKNALSKTEDAA